MNYNDSYDSFEEEYECKLPKKNIVCPDCDGTGSQMNPSIDHNGITQSEMSELGDDFLDNYLSGYYHITCLGCDGNNVVPVVDTTNLSDYLKKELSSWMESEYEYQAIAHAERMMGA